MVLQIKNSQGASNYLDLQTGLYYKIHSSGNFVEVLQSNLAFKNFPLDIVHPLSRGKGLDTSLEFIHTLGQMPDIEQALEKYNIAFDETPEEEVPPFEEFDLEDNGLSEDSPARTLFNILNKRARRTANYFKVPFVKANSYGLHSVLVFNEQNVIRVGTNVNMSDTNLYVFVNRVLTLVIPDAAESFRRLYNEAL